MLKYALLGFLKYAPMTGYELKQFMDQSTANFWHAKQSQIYTTLKRLEEDGMLKSRLEFQEGRPDRRVYTISAEGQADLAAWLSHPQTELENRKELFLLKLFFSAELDKEKLLTQFRLLQDLHQQQKDHYENETEAFIRQISGSLPGLEKDAKLWDATRRFGVLFEQMYLQWLEETIEMIEESNE